jgi:hypothetical protein
MRGSGTLNAREQEDAGRVIDDVLCRVVGLGDKCRCGAEKPNKQNTQFDLQL